MNGDIENVAETLKQNGFIIIAANPAKISLNKGYTKDGFADQVFHIHLRYAGDNDELYFRDYLNEHTDIAREYETLKLRLWKKNEHNRDAYTEAKSEFIQHWTQAAKKEYGNRY